MTAVARYIGEYEIVRRLRVGGMATLYLGRRHGAAGFSKLAAIKVVHPHLLDQPTFIEMFVDEARICSQISHPNVVNVQEFGEVDGLHYLVMEYLDGISMSELLHEFRAENTTLDPELAAHIIMMVARGLHAAHETADSDGASLEIVHRDISPSNILLTTDGTVKLIDFGIAKARNRIAETEAGFAMKGKYRYIAPEQATRTQIDRRSDLFSLGVVFWELLTGVHLFDDDTQIGLFNRLTETRVRQPSVVNPEALVLLDSLVLQLLDHDPAARPQTAGEVAKRISSLLPSAANRDAAELGALALRIRDKRRAERTNEREGIGGTPSFSPTPRSSSRIQAIPTDADYRVEITAPPQALMTVAEALPAQRPGLVAPAPTGPMPSQVSPPTRSRARRTLAIAGAAIATLIVVTIVVARGGASAPTPAASVPTPTPEPIARKTAPAALAAAPAAATAPPPALESPPLPPAPTIARSRTPQRTPVAARRAVAPADTIVTTPAESPRGEARPTAAAAKIRASGATFTGASFDDDGNAQAGNAKPARAKVKGSTIVTDFGD